MEILLLESCRLGTIWATPFKHARKGQEIDRRTHDLTWKQYF